MKYPRRSTAVCDLLSSRYLFWATQVFELVQICDTSFCWKRFRHSPVRWQKSTLNLVILLFCLTLSWYTFGTHGTSQPILPSKSKICIANASWPKSQLSMVWSSSEYFFRDYISEQLLKMVQSCYKLMNIWSCMRCWRALANKRLTV